MKSKWIFLLLMSALIIPALGADGRDKKDRKKEPKGTHRFINASIFYPLSTNKSKYDSAEINLSLFYGRVGRVSGFDLSGLVSVMGKELKGVSIAGLSSVVGDRMKGLQVSGLGNVAGDTAKGVQLGGIFNIAGDELNGVQGAGIFNIAGEAVSGVQAAGIFNIAGEDFRGIQGSAIFNITGEDFSGIQGAEIFNIVGEDFNGLQSAGIFNVVGGSMTGLQTSLLNVAPKLKGMQAGLVNVAETVRGVQLGLVNYAKRYRSGVPVGVVNIAKEGGDIRFTAWGSNVMAVQVGVKFMVNRVYSIVTVGGSNLYDDKSESISYGFHYGIHFPVDQVFFDMDLGYMTVDNKDFFRSHRGDLDQHMLMLRGMVGVNVARGFSLFAGGGLRYGWDHGRGVQFDSGETKPMFFAGIELF